MIRKMLYIRGTVVAGEDNCIFALQATHVIQIVTMVHGATNLDAVSPNHLKPYAKYNNNTK